MLLDENGQIIRDARKIIYPGSNGNPWWDNKQLMEQMTSAIEIFEAAHPDCQALFVFDQSSAHGSLPDDALKAFEMNKSDGGVQHRQRNTIIPDLKPRSPISISTAINDHCHQKAKRLAGCS